MIGALVVSVFGGTIFIFAKSPLTYAISNAVTGFGLNPAYILGFVIVNEAFGKKHTAKSIVVIEDKITLIKDSICSK